MKRSELPLILVVNPGSTSTKVAAFRGRREIFQVVIAHDHKWLKKNGERVIGQTALRRNIVLRELKKRGIALSDVRLFAARGGLLRPLPSGVYRVNEAMLRDLRECRHGEHASNLGAIIAWELAAGRTKDVFIADPVVVDELAPEARITGIPGFERRSVFHALNQKAVARKVAARLGRPYGKCRLIVAHVGGGISIAVHKFGQVVDVNNALEADGPFTCERAGCLPLLAFMEHANRSGWKQAGIRNRVLRRGGLLAHLGTNDCRVVERMVRSGNKKVRVVFAAFVYQMARGIGAAAAALSGKVDAVALTGNVMKCRWVRSRLTSMVRFIAPVHVIAGSLEMEALAAAALDVYEGHRRAVRY